MVVPNALSQVTYLDLCFYNTMWSMQQCIPEHWCFKHNKELTEPHTCQADIVNKNLLL